MNAGGIRNLGIIRETGEVNIQQRKNDFMKTTNNLIDRIIPLTQSKWILPILTALALATATLGVTGCSPPHH